MQLNNTHILKDINNADESQKHYAENKNPDQKKKINTCIFILWLSNSYKGKIVVTETISVDM